MANYIDMAGKTFGRFKVLQRDKANAQNGSIGWLCQCSCGTFKIVDGYGLRAGRIVSCGHCKETLQQSAETGINTKKQTQKTASQCINRKKNRLFWNNYKSLCDRAGITMQMANVKLNISVFAHYNWKNGHVPRLKTQMKIAEFFGVNHRDLMTKDTVTRKEAVASDIIVESRLRNELIQIFDAMPMSSKALVFAHIYSTYCGNSFKDCA
jgi:hypothetical protein